MDVRLAELATRQHGVVAIGQLRALGLSTRGTCARVERGKLHRVHRGVYSVGHSVLTDRGRWMAAVLACGPTAVLSHRSAAALWGLRPDSRPRVEVTSRRTRGQDGIHAHRSGTLLPRDVTTFQGIPCTAVARTLLDLAEVVPARQLERALQRAEMLRLFDLRALEDVLARTAGRRGASLLRNALCEPPEATKNEFERRFLRICRKAGLPRPRVNEHVNGREVDFHWPAHRLIAETDGRGSHATRFAFEDDRRRDQEHAVAGWRVVRFTWRQLRQEPQAVAETLRALLHV